MAVFEKPDEGSGGRVLEHEEEDFPDAREALVLDEAVVELRVEEARDDPLERLELARLLE